MNMGAPSTIASSEHFLKGLGLTQCHVGIHDELVRICTSATEMNRLIDHSIRETIVQGFKELGFNYVSLDLEEQSP
jgi:uncharacterized protein